MTHDIDGPADERCESCGRLDPINCPCPPDEDEDDVLDLIEAGAPPLPEGFFYRVGRIGLDATPAVQIRRRRRWGSSLRMAARIRTWDDGREIPVDEAVLTAAEEAHRTWTRTDRLTLWTGDHPR